VCGCVSADNGGPSVTRRTAPAALRHRILLRCLSASVVSEDLYGTTSQAARCSSQTSAKPAGSQLNGVRVCRDQWQLAVNTDRLIDNAEFGFSFVRSMYEKCPDSTEAQRIFSESVKCFIFEGEIRFLTFVFSERRFFYRFKCFICGKTPFTLF